MSRGRGLVGTRKGAFVLTSDGKRERWDGSGPHFGGWEIYHLKGSPADPNRLYASQSSSWFGQQIQRSNDGGKTWEPVGNKFVYDGVPGTHQWYDGTPHPWEFARVWHLEPSPTDPDTVYAGVEDAALFRSTDGGQTWQELPGLRGHRSAPSWQPGAGGMCLHTILLDPTEPGRILIAVWAPGVFRPDDAGKTWRPVNRGLRSENIPDPTAEVGHCVHRIAVHRSRPRVLFMQKHWDVMRSDDAGESWQEVSGNLPTDFGFPIDVHAHEPDTIYVVPIKSDSEHYPPEGKLRVYRSRTGGHEWEALTQGLPQHVDVAVASREALRERLPLGSAGAAAGHEQAALGRTVRGVALYGDDVDGLRLVRVYVDREPEVAREVPADHLPRRAGIVAAHDVPVLLHEQHAGARAVHRDAVNAVADLGGRVGELLGLEATVDRSPRLPGVVGPEGARRGDGYEHPFALFRIEKDRVQAHPTRTRLPGGRRFVIAQSRKLLPSLGAVGRAKQGGVLDAGVERVRIGRRRLQMPHARELPRVGRAVVPQA